MNTELIKSYIRNAIGLIGGVLVGIGVATPEHVDTLLANYDAIIGGAMAIIAFGWATWDKLKATIADKF